MLQNSLCSLLFSAHTAEDPLHPQVAALHILQGEPQREFPNLPKTLCAGENRMPKSEDNEE
jgi:hypothetical protein